MNYLTHYKILKADDKISPLSLAHEASIKFPSQPESANWRNPLPLRNVIAVSDS